MKIIYSLALWAFISAFCMLKAEDLPKTNFTKISDLKSDTWAAAGESDGKAFRSVIAGKRGEFSFPNWWGDTVRPPYGSIYIFEIQYQDKIKTPAIAFSFGGVATYQNPSEIHRFGGEGDGAWKTAYIPVSWDLMMLKEGEKNIKFYIQNTDKENELPLADIVCRKAKLPEDRIRYEAESRAWVKKQLASNAEKIPAPEKTLDLGEKYKNKVMVPFARAYYDRIERHYLPTLEEVEGRVYIRASTNEFEPGSFGVHAQQDLKDITYQVSDFTNKDGKLDCQVQLFTMEFAPMVKKNKDKTDLYYYSAERLWQAYPESLKKGENAWFWFNIKTTDGKSKPGTYEGTITITSGNIKEILPIRVDVLPVKLLTMAEAGLWNGGCVSGLTTEQELETMKDYHHNMVNLWIAGAAPGMKKGKDKVDINFYYLNDYMKNCTKNGVGRIVWFFGGNPPGFPQTLSLERELYSIYYEKSQEDFFKILQEKEKRDKIIPEIRDIYKNFVADLIKHGDENKWPEAILTPFDEPVKYSYPSTDKNYKFAVGTGLWTREHFIDSCNAIHEASPKTKVYISMHHNKEKSPFGRVGEVFIPYVDVVNTNAIDEDPNLNRKVLDKGKEFWQYGGTWGGRYNFGFYFGVHESTGSLVWAYNWAGRFNASGKRGDQYAYNTPFGTIVTPEYEMFREAWDDRLYLKTYLISAEKKGIDTKEFFASLKKEVLENLGENTEDKVDTFYVKELDKNKLERIRSKLAQKIIDLKK